MLKGISEKIDELGEYNIYAALVGSHHYENFLKFPEEERGVEILHINKRLEALGTDVRYNESDY
jgi:translation initiation factor 6 (eIF-6)